MRETSLSQYRGGHKSSSPIVLSTVSGIASTDSTMALWCATHCPFDIISTKSIQHLPNLGNREPILTEVSAGSFGNAVGLRNPGVHAFLQKLIPIRRLWPHNRILNISIAGASVEEFALLAQLLCPYADSLELNLSCPHAHGGYGTQIGASPQAVYDCVSAVYTVISKSQVALLAKIPPTSVHLEDSALACKEAGADGIVAINTLGPRQYREAHSGHVILNNPAPDKEDEAHEGLGGMSGRWIYDIAYQKIQQIRDTIGEDMIIIGMGGVESHYHATQFRTAGADIVGIGSVLSRIHQSQWASVLHSIRTPHNSNMQKKNTNPSKLTLRPSADMAFTPYTIQQVIHRTDTIFEIELDTNLSFQPGQTVFIWLPTVGEKPFSPALSSPLRFIIARKGVFTQALGTLVKGDTVYIRGPYGSGVGTAPTPSTDNTHALIVTAGTGTALMPSLIDMLQSQGHSTEGWIGLREATHGMILEEGLDKNTNIHIVEDNGIQARVLKEIPHATRSKAISYWYTVGPTAFMSASVELARTMGIKDSHIWLSLEQQMMCGVGLCGTCHYKGQLTCNHGTFVSAARWNVANTIEDTETISHSQDKSEIL